MRAFVALFTLSISQAASAGIRLEYQEENSDKESGSSQRMELQGDKLRFDRTVQGNPDTRTMIFDGTQIITVDSQAKTYMVIDPAAVKAQMDAIKARLSPEARANLEKATQGKDDLGKVTFRKSTGGETVLGFSCTNYTQLRDGVEHGSVCVASWKDGPVKKDEISALIKLTKQMASTYLPTGVTKKSMLFDPDEWPGFPLATHSEGGKTGRLTSLKRGSIPDSEFQVPAGYTQKAMPAFGGGHHP
jgi:hypothetical protein